MPFPPHAFTHQIKVVETDIDELGHVNNVVYVRYVQEVSAAHWAQVAPAELQEKYLWVVLRHEIDFLKPAFSGDTILGATWVGDHKGAKFERNVHLYKLGSVELLCTAKTIWVLVDAKTMRPRRIEEDVIKIL